MNMFNLDVTQKCLIAECWCPVDDLEKIQIAIKRGTVSLIMLQHLPAERVVGEKHLYCLCCGLDCHTFAVFPNFKKLSFSLL